MTKYPIMKIAIRLMIFILIIPIENTCRNEQQTDINNSSFFTIDFPKILKNRQKALISNIADSVYYIRLSTSKESLLGRIMDAKFTDNYIFIQHNGNGLLAQFNFKGDFIRNIGKQGRGPEEYSLIREFSIDEEKQIIYIQANYKKEILAYSFDGEYINSLKKLGSEGWIAWARDSAFIQFHEPVMGNEKYIFIEKNSEGDTLQVVNNHSFWDKNKRTYYMTGYWGRNVFYYLNNRLHFKGWYNDTVYTISNTNKIIPEFFIDLKQYKLPDELRPERNPSLKIPPKYYWTGVRESSKYIFFHYSVYSLKIDAKEKEGYMYYDKQSGEGYTLTKNKGGKGFMNDMDGGPDFVPDYTTHSAAIHFIDAHSFISHINSEYFRNSKPKYPKQKVQLVKNMKTLSESDNPIVMILSLKEK